MYNNKTKFKTKEKTKFKKGMCYIMYKLVAIDLDGTLLNSYSQVSEIDKQAIKEAKEKGIQIILCSGRNPISVKSIASELGLNNYIVCGNGSMIYDLKEDKIIYNKFIDKEKVLKIVKICEENSIYYSVNTNTDIITKSLNYNVLFYHHENEKRPENKKIKINIVQDVYKYIEERKEEDYLKVNISDSNNIIFEGIIRKLREISKIDVLDVEHMSRKKIKVGTEDINVEYYYTELTAQNVNKWNAIDYLINLLNIKKEEVIAIGDNINDKEMFENAGLGVAMENSAPYIKEFADEITLDNNSYGVAEVLRKYIV